MLWQVYSRKGLVYVPTVARTEAGYYMDIDPVEVVPAKDTPSLERAIKKAISNGNPIVPTPSRAAFPEPVVLKYAGMKSWRAFENGASNWTIVQKDGIYEIKPGRKRLDKGWEDDPAKVESLPRGVRLDEVAQRVAILIQERADQSE